MRTKHEQGKEERDPFAAYAAISCRGNTLRVVPCNVAPCRPPLSLPCQHFPQFTHSLPPQRVADNQVTADRDHEAAEDAPQGARERVNARRRLLYRRYAQTIHKKPVFFLAVSNRGNTESPSNVKKIVRFLGKTDETP